MIVPVGVVQSGWVMETVGADGVDGWAFTTALVEVDVQPAAFCAVTLYVALAATPVKTPIVLL